MFKRFIITSFILLISLFLSQTIAQEKKAGQNVQQVNFRFCDMIGSTKGVKEFSIKQGEEQELCLNFSTNADTEFNVKYGRSEGLLNKGGFPVCDHNISDNKFSKFFSNNDLSKRSFTLSKGEEKIINEKINMPIGVDGVIYGCLAFEIGMNAENKNSIVQILERRVTPIKIFVGDMGDIQSKINFLKTASKYFSSNKKIGAKIVNNRLNLNFSIQNNGNIDQNISFSGTIYNILGFEKTFEITKQKIAPNEKKEINLDIGVIPFYKGFFSINSNLIGEPVFEFDNGSIDEKFKKTITIEQNGQIFIFTWIWIVVLAFAILILRLIIKPLFKKHPK